MELMLKNVQKKHLALIAELAKTLKIELSEPTEDDSYYLNAMKDGEKSEILGADEKAAFIKSLKSK